MSHGDRVLWSEGLFLRAQHFQEQDRHTEALVRGALQAGWLQSWGYRSLTLDPAHVVFEGISTGGYRFSGEVGVRPADSELSECEGPRRTTRLAGIVADRLPVVGRHGRRPARTPLSARTGP